VKDRDAAKLSTVPFCLVSSEVGVHGLEERADEGHLEHRPDNAMFAVLVASWEVSVAVFVVL
jgi:hypothetical protein